MIKKTSKLSIAAQCSLLSVNRSTFYYKPVPETDFNLELMKVIDKFYMKRPYLGYRAMTKRLRRLGYKVGKKRVRRLMGLMGISSIYRKKKKTTIPNKQHLKYPYLLKDLIINRPNQVWCTDITYIPMKRGFIYLVGIMDWYSRKILSWRVSNTMDVSFCIDALEEALTRHGKPEIFNSDQGCQFTSQELTEILLEKSILISMDGKGRAIDNVFIERFWKSLKYEEVYLKAYETVKDAVMNIGEYIYDYNNDRPHTALGDNTPEEIYSGIKSLVLK
jgi:putative transposase